MDLRLEKRFHTSLPGDRAAFGEARLGTLWRIWGFGFDFTVSRDHVSAHVRLGPVLADVSATYVPALPPMEKVGET